ncbi:MAG: putative Mg2+ transporter-C (MgtC) family protein [Actinomycetota bacterium]|nr:putative Mg2+ transporter-C (MgtC) family protein [Actinomycetota bacterium]
MTEFMLVARVVLGALLGYIIGWEREYRGSAAGDRTFSLVALGATAFTALGVENFPATAEKLIAGVVTGVGFLGAGLILKGNGGQVVGLTTAASLWAVAALGVVAGAGEYVMALCPTALVVLILESHNLPVLRRAARAGNHDQRANLEE